MNTIAIVVSYGRAELGELFTMWIKQTHATPLLVWLDGYAGSAHAPDGVHVHRAERTGPNATIGDVRAAAVELARELYSLGPSDSFLVLDDDDYYSPTHAERTIEALERSPHGCTGALRAGYQWQRDMMPPEIVIGGWGAGQHATWGLRLETYDRAGGYRGDVLEDVELANRIGLERFAGHYTLTHVRRQFSVGCLSSAARRPKAYDREQLRSVRPAAEWIAPAWRPELGELEIWARTYESMTGDV